MCGIAGIVAFDDRFRVTRETLEGMSRAIAHRGPDADGLYLNHESEITPDHPQVGLVHRRLSIIDLDPRANQPFTDHQGRWVVFNGEIYNYRELRSELTKRLPDYAWRTTSDTEVLLAAYAAWGEKCVEQLNGMFAFGIWDENDKSLFLARDRMGQKPLYYAFAPNAQAVAFASEIPALLRLPWLDTAISQPQLAEYLRWGYLPSDTIYQHIFKLPAAHYQIVHSSHGGVWRYANVNDPGPSTSSPSPASTRQLILQAVQRQLVADVPVGCFLSGGTDSSIVALCMKKAAPNVLTFTIGFDDPRYDEIAYAAAVAKHLGTEHRQFIVKPNAAEDLPRLAAVFGGPFADSSALPTHYLARETRQHVKVALAGDGGDELFAGYDRYRAMQIGATLQRLPRPLRGLLTAAARLLPGSHPKSLPTRFRRLLASLDLPPGQRYASYLRIFDEPTLSVLLESPSPTQSPAPDHIYAQLQASRDLVESALAADRLTYLPEDLHAKVDRAAMLHALEVRSPFMDTDLLAFAAALKTNDLLSTGPKHLLRQAFAADLPDFVFKRKKMGFAVPIGDWFRTSLRAMLHDHLFAADSFASRHFSRPTIQRLIDEHEQFRVDHSQRLYALLMLELWWRGQRSATATSA